MLDQVVGKATGGVGQTLAAGAEGGAQWFLSLALSPMGLSLMVVALAVALWKARG
ncbi:MAG TPA: hypothetical protein VMM55_07710 [Thermohalobaculum sp.]|nr:hypothetical protein [Thermohalobaculum sp.]